MGARFSAPLHNGPGPNYPPVQWVPGLFRGIKRLGCEVEHPPSRCTFNPAPGLHGLFRGAFYLYFYSHYASDDCPGRTVARHKMQVENQLHIPLETLTVAQLIKNFPAIYSTRTHVHCCGHKTPPLVPIRSQMNPAHTLSPYFF